MSAVNHAVLDSPSPLEDNVVVPPLPMRILDRRSPQPEVLAFRGALPVSRVPSRASQPRVAAQVREVDPFYLFACHVEWELRQDPTAAWELLSAANSPQEDTRAHARALLNSSRHLRVIGSPASSQCLAAKKRQDSELEMKPPYGLEIIDSCAGCATTNSGFFCGCSPQVLEALDKVSNKSILPPGAILFVEGQAPRGMFILCSGRVHMSTTSREGKTLLLKTAVAGEALGLSACVSGMGYEHTAETASPCHINFIDRKHFLELMMLHTELGMHAAQCLSRDFRSAHRDIHDLVLTRSSVGKLARLLLSQSPEQDLDSESRVSASMTHEEMAQRIGASRETVTRLLTTLRKRQLIRLDGATLVIRNRSGLEAMAT